MSIPGVSAASILDNLYTSRKTGSISPVADPSQDAAGQTISQIRDKVDKLALSGQLTSLQQVELIESGFQDLNAGDPSYQPAGQTGYTRATTGTYDLASTLEGYGEFDATHGDLVGAARFTDLADFFRQDKDFRQMSVQA